MLQKVLQNNEKMQHACHTVVAGAINVADAILSSLDCRLLLSLARCSRTLFKTTRNCNVLVLHKVKI